MNNNLLRYINKSNKSVYRISKETGIPYTILSELVTGKKSINKIASETVCKLCIYFGCSIEDLMNDFIFFNNISGKYHGKKYKWTVNNDKITLFVDGKEIKSYEHIYTQNPQLYAKACAELHIEELIKIEQFERDYKQLIE